MAALVLTNRKASALAVLVLMLALGAFAALCSPGDLPPQSTLVITERKWSDLPERARLALTRPSFRDYANLGRRLPAPSEGSYHEHAIDGAPSNERIIRSADGVVFYTTDNFHSAIRVRETAPGP